VLVDVVAVLIVPVPIVYVIDVVSMQDGLAVVVLGVGLTVVGVHLALRVLFAVVEMVHVVIMGNCLAAVVRQVLVVQLLGVCAHENSSVCWTFSFLPSS
jgi:hypothetical protein